MLRITRGESDERERDEGNGEHAGHAQHNPRVVRSIPPGLARATSHRQQGGFKARRAVFTPTVFTLFHWTPRPGGTRGCDRTGIGF